MSEEDQMEISPKEDDTEIDELKTLYETAERENNFALFNAILDNPRSDDVAIKVKEQSIYKVAKFYADSKDFELIMNLLKQNADFFSVIPKAKTAKIVRNLLNIVSSTPDSLVAQVNLYTEVVEWCKVEKRTFLRQRIEGKVLSC
jgi:26S proteasome regulatory subunit N6